MDYPEVGTALLVSSGPLDIVCQLSILSRCVSVFFLLCAANGRLCSVDLMYHRAFRIARDLEGRGHLFVETEYSACTLFLSVLPEAVRQTDPVGNTL